MESFLKQLLIKLTGRFLIWIIQPFIKCGDAAVIIKNDTKNKFKIKYLFMKTLVIAPHPDDEILG